MRAITYTEYGSADVLNLHEVPDPLVGPDTVLVRTAAAGVNPVDYKIREGYLQGALPHHLPIIPGWDVAGTVEQVGAGVQEFSVGDAVLGYVRRDDVQQGTYAELVAAPVRTLVHRPAGLDAVAAAALPLAGLTAVQSLRAVSVGAGDTVLVHAAAGGVGHLGVQLARELGARVIGTASPRNHDFVRSLGAEPIAYGEGLDERVRALVGGDGLIDAVLDFVGGEALTSAPGLLRDRSRHVSIVDAATVAEQGGRYCFVRPDRDDLTWLADLAATGKIRVEVAETFPLANAADAQRLVEGGHVRGKVAIVV